MIRPTEFESTALVELAHACGLFVPPQLGALKDHLDYTARFPCNKEEGQCLVFDQDGEPVAFVVFRLVPGTVGTWAINWLVVRADLRSLGVGSALLQFLEHQLRHQEQGRLLLFEADPQASGLDLAMHHYEKTAAVPDYFADGVAKVIYRKRLNY